MRREPAVGVVDAQVQAELCARGKHAVGFVCALGDEIVDQDRGIGFGAVENQRRLGLHLESCVDPRHNSLAGSLFVPGCPIYLPRKKQARNLLRFQSAFEFRGIDGVVFDRIARAQHLRCLQAGDRFQDLQLHFHRQRSAHAVDINFVRVQSFRFEVELVHFLVGKFHDLVFDRWAVARADRLNLTAVHRRAMNVLANDAMRFGRGPRDVAGHLGIVVLHPPGTKAEGRGIVVSRLQDEARPIDRAAVEAWRGSGLQAAAAQAEFFQCFPEQNCIRLSGASGGILLLTAVNKAV